MSVDTTSTAMWTSVQQLQHEVEDSGLEQGDIIQDVQIFQGVAMEYQLAYQPNSMSVDTSSTAMSMSVQQLQREVEDSGLGQGDIVQDAPFFKDAVTEYQLAYQSLKEK